jgi:hypothetical protein
MKVFKGFLCVLLAGWIMIGCGGGGSSESQESTAEMSSQEQAEIVAAALTADQGGVGKDVEQIADPAETQSQASVDLDLTVSVELVCYDAESQPLEECDHDTTDAIEYHSAIQGQFTSNVLYFQDFVIDNHSDFTAAELLSGMALIQGTHSNHSSYARSSSFNNVEVLFNLDSELVVKDLVIDREAWDRFPEAGTVEGNMSGSYQRSSSFSNTAVEFDFGFIATYMGDNTAEIELSNGAVFSVHLGTCKVTEVE